MRAADYVGRIGALAVALGIGFACASNQGIAYAEDTESSASSHDSGSSPDPDQDTDTAEPDDEPTADEPEEAEEDESPDDDELGDDELDPPIDDSEPDDLAAEQPPVDDADLPSADDDAEPDRTRDHSHVESATSSTDLAATGSLPEPTISDEGNNPVESASEPDAPIEATTPVDAPVSAARLFTAPTSDESIVAADTVAPQALTVPVITPIAIITTVLSGALASLLAPTPGGPADSPLLLGVLAWVRREIHRTFFNQSPSLAYDPVSTEQIDADTVVGSVTGTDPDGDDDDLRYSVTQTTAKGGTVTIDDDGTFTYVAPADRPDGPFTDTFTVTVNDAHSSHHLHGLASLLRPGRGHTDTVDVEVTVGEFNTPPTATLSANPPDSDGVVGVTFSYSDSAADSLAVTRPEPALGDWGSGYSQYVTDGVTQYGSWSYNYVPDPWAQLAAYRGTGPLSETLTFTVSDGVNPPVERSVDVPITPVKTVLVTSVSDPDPETGLVRVTLSYEDADAAPLSFTEPTPEYGTLELESQSVIVIIDPEGPGVRNYQRVYRYTPDEAARIEAYYGGTSSEDLAFSVSDGTAVTARTVTVPILPLEAPVPESV